MSTNLFRDVVRHVTWPDNRTQVPQVRIEVNFKCGKACFYCRPTGEGLSVADLERLVQGSVREMTLDEIVAVTALLVRHGVTDIKLTGGDPMLRDDIIEIVAQLKAIPGLASLHLVTRNSRAGELAGALKEAGLDLLNFSIDSLDSATWTRITRVAGHAKLIGAARLAARSGIPMKINTVVLKGINDGEIPALVKNFAGELGAELKLLDLINDIGAFPARGAPVVDEHYADLVPVAEWLATWADSYEIVTQAGGLGHPMPRFRMPNGATVTVKSARFGAYYGSVCAGCQFFPCWDALMALRVTPNGMLQYCLKRVDNLIDLLSLLRSKATAQADEAVERAMSVYQTARPYTGEAISQMRTERQIVSADVRSAGAAAQ